MLISESIDRMRLSAVSHDELVGGDLHGRYDGWFWISPLVETTEQVRQGLDEVMASLLRQRTLAIHRAKVATGSLDANLGLRRAREAFAEQLATVHVESTSADGLVTAVALEGTRITFEIAPNALDHGHQVVADSASEAARAVAPKIVQEVRRINRESTYHRD